MHLVVINCSPRTVSKSNTNIIMQEFIKGYTAGGNTAELHHLSQRNQWENIRKAYYENNNILMAVPLFVECIPGLMMEFLESLTVKEADENGRRTKLGFLLQGGFPEASQLRCCEKYLQQLPEMLGCENGGTLIKGEMFAIHMLPEKAQKGMTKIFCDMGAAFAADGRFEKEKADAFAGEEYFSKRARIQFKMMGPVQKLFFKLFFKKLGCKGKLTAKPYENVYRR